MKQTIYLALVAIMLLISLGAFTGPLSMRTRTMTKKELLEAKKKRDKKVKTTATRTKMKITYGMGMLADTEGRLI